MSGHTNSADGGAYSWPYQYRPTEENELATEWPEERWQGQVVEPPHDQTRSYSQTFDPQGRQMIASGHDEMPWGMGPVGRGPLSGLYNPSLLFQADLSGSHPAQFASALQQTPYDAAFGSATSTGHGVNAGYYPITQTDFESTHPVYHNVPSAQAANSAQPDWGADQYNAQSAQPIHPTQVAFQAVPIGSEGADTHSSIRTRGSRHYRKRSGASSVRKERAIEVRTYVLERLRSLSVHTEPEGYSEALEDFAKSSLIQIRDLLNIQDNGSPLVNNQFGNDKNRTSELDLLKEALTGIIDNQYRLPVGINASMSDLQSALSSVGDFVSFAHSSRYVSGDMIDMVEYVLKYNDHLDTIQNFSEQALRITLSKSQRSNGSFSKKSLFGDLVREVGDGKLDEEAVKKRLAPLTSAFQTLTQIRNYNAIPEQGSEERMALYRVLNYAVQKELLPIEDRNDFTESLDWMRQRQEMRESST
ncbi:uncharacterized protein I303_102383 [Kwoniella dejecticola CBS 10117]|uniref:Uncharacterized protein n=1 Tax=Kwoniella dejecticola CBS 10117 TaxID=1296121 RepID=A0A1A6AB46_9TREE|nr:uncharacterized protein I303_01477 [Kwoniella dejecticola CBS 10117]OBR87275.1 hypothetical protein I303_01477 [Kwoniella dejecticola CBS 10117]